MVLALALVPVGLSQVDVVVGLHGVALLGLPLHLLDGGVEGLAGDEAGQGGHAVLRQPGLVESDQVLVGGGGWGEERVAGQVHHLLQVETAAQLGGDLPSQS